MIVYFVLFISLINLLFIFNYLFNFLFIFNFSKSKSIWLFDERLGEQKAVLECRCALLRKEAVELANDPNTQPLPVVALAIIQQPFPLSLIQNKQIDEPIVLRLLCGTRTEIESLSDVEAHLIVNYTPKNANELELLHGTAPMPVETLTARLSTLKFKHGTRKKKAILKFRQKVHVSYQGRSVALDVESNASKPFVVKVSFFFLENLFAF